MWLVTDPPLVHCADRLVKVDADAPKLLIRTPQRVGLGRSDRERKTRLVAKQQPDNVAGGAVFPA